MFPEIDSAGFALSQKRHEAMFSDGPTDLPVPEHLLYSMAQLPVQMLTVPHDVGLLGAPQLRWQ